MKRCPRLPSLGFAFWAAAASACVFLSGAVEAATGIPFDAQCTVKIDGKSLVYKRECEVHFFANLAGPLTCGETTGVSACVECDQKTICRAYWGEGGERAKADRSLGRVKPVRKTDCWVNRRARICFENLKECPGSRCARQKLLSPNRVR